MTERIPVMRPQLPTADDLLPYLRRIDEARYYSNHGQLLRELEARLATFYGVDPSNVAVVANGTVALSAALLAVGAKPGGRCLVPSWTFVASAAAAWAANLQPHFVDVDEATWMLDPQALRERRDLAGVEAVIVVSPFGAPVDTQAWDAFTDDTGIPVVIDCAAAFDAVRTVARSAPGRSPIMISLHATKALGSGEGGLLISRDERVMERINQVCNFGVWNSPGQILGYNGKQSEYHSAVGLAAVSAWPQRREALRALTQAYREKLSVLEDVALVPGYGDEWVSCYCNVRLRNEAGDVIAQLDRAGIDTRRWWQRGVHRQQAYQGFSHDPLPVTEYLADRVFGLPFYHDMPREHVERVVEAFSRAIVS